MNILTLAYPNEEIHEGILRYTAIVVQSVACLMLFLARKLCFVFNSMFAAFKIILLTVIFVVAFAKSRGSGLQDFNVSHGDFSAVRAMQSMIYILNCYPVWDNVNMVRKSLALRRTLPYFRTLTVTRLRGKSRIVKEHSNGRLLRVH